jgi:hypothetical protein
VAALMRGRAEAEYWRERGVIYAAALFLQGQVEVVPPRPNVTAPYSAPKIAFERIVA